MKNEFFSPLGITKGKLTIFFGMCGGVGKTETMLADAIQLKNKGLDVVIAHLNKIQHPHEYDLLMGLNDPNLVPQSVIDMDALLERSPALVVIDEYAHNNPPESRHTFRYQDIDELLNAGINVYTTLSVIHIESISYVIKNNFNLDVTDTVPDLKFEKADTIVLVEMSVDKVIENIKNIKFSGFETSHEELVQFFSLKNIIFLSEMTHQVKAQKHDKQVNNLDKNELEDGNNQEVRLLVCFDETSDSEAILQRAKNISLALGGSFYAFYPEEDSNLSYSQKEQLNLNIKLAYRLGAYFNSSSCCNWRSEVDEIIKREKITHVVIGLHNKERSFSSIWRTDPIIKLMQDNPHLELHLISNQKETSLYKKKWKWCFYKSSIREYYRMTLLTVLFSFLIIPLYGFLQPQGIAYLALIVLAIESIFFKSGPILFGALLSYFIIDFFFTKPYLEVSLLENSILLLLLFLAIPFTQSIYISKVKRTEENSRKRENRISSMFLFAEQLSTSVGVNEVIKMAIESIKTGFKLECAFLLANTEELQLDTPHAASDFYLDTKELNIAHWVIRNGRPAGKLTDTYQNAHKTFYPITCKGRHIGIIVIIPPSDFDENEETLWLSFIRQVANAIEREMLREQANHLSIMNKSDTLYQTLFSSISHEFRSPVTTILTGSETLLSVSNYGYKEIADAIYTSAKRLHRLIENLLNMTRIESGHLSLRLDWHDTNDLINNILHQLENESSSHTISIYIPNDMPLIKIDIGLFEQVLYNLVYNSILYTPPGSLIEIEFSHTGNHVHLNVKDNGNGFSEETLKNIFAKFYRGSQRTGGIGLGMSIIKGYIDAHKGVISAKNQATGGALVSIDIPSEIPSI